MADAAKTPTAAKTEPTEAEIRAKFVETTNKRTSAAIRSIANVAKLPTKGRKPSDAGVIVAALRKALDQTEARLASGKDATPEFALDA